MKRLALLGATALFLLSACSEDSDSATSPAKNSSADMEVATYEMLPSCAEKREGKTAYVKDQDQGYICQNEKWVESDDAVDVYPSAIKEGSFTDSRDGKKYRMVTIGSQTWMAENLNFKTDSSFCYNDSAEYCSKYGRLYTWAAAVGVCPKGWHLPSQTEWGVLITAVGGSSVAGKKLKSMYGWTSSGNGTDAFAFSILPAGYRSNNGHCYNEDDLAGFWSSTEYSSNHAYDVNLNYGYDDVELNYSSKSKGLSVRCIRDDASEQSAKSSSSSVAKSSSSVKVASSSSIIKSSSSSVVVVNSAKVTLGSMTDSRDGQIYKTVKIGSQTWMAQNLNYETASSYCYRNDANNCAKYGRLYTWLAVTSACPTSWHLPSQTEWNTLITAVGGLSVAGKKLKSMSGWYDNGDGTDSFSFSVLPAGYRDLDGIYSYEGYDARFWSSTEYNSSYVYGSYAYRMSLNYNYDDVSLSSNNKIFGFSIRCLMDDESEQSAKSSSSAVAKSSSSEKIAYSSSILSSSSWSSEGTIGEMTDSRDAQTYKTVKIGSQTWMAQNLNFEIANSYCYKDSLENCSKYGRLYLWAAAVGKTEYACGYGHACSLPSGDIQGVCPLGWHLPSKAEWETLFTALGGRLNDWGVELTANVGSILKSIYGWASDEEGKYGNGTDAYLFSALPAGYKYDDGSYVRKGDFAHFWSSTEFSKNEAYSMDLYFDDSSAYLYYYNKDFGYSVRCLKDEP